MKPAVYLLNACLSVAYAILKHSPDENWVSCPRASENFWMESRKMIVGSVEGHDGSSLEPWLIHTDTSG